MSEEIREKSVTEKKLEKVLTISDELKKLDEEEKAQVSSEDDEKKRKLQERKEYLAEVKENLSTLKSKSDLDFSKSIYKDLILTDMEILRITRKEMEMDPSAKYMEGIATLSNAIVGAIDSLRDVDKTTVDQGFEREKIDMKKNQGGNVTNNNVVLVGNYTDIMSKVEQIRKDKEKIIDVEIVPDKKG